MARGIFITLFAVLLLGAVAGAAYQVGATVAYQAGATAGTAAGTAAGAAYPYMWHPFAIGFFPFFSLLFPIFFLFLMFGILRAIFGGGRGHGYGRGWGGPRMMDEWHREAHERGIGKGES